MGTLSETQKKSSPKKVDWEEVCRQKALLLPWIKGRLQLFFKEHPNIGCEIGPHVFIELCFFFHYKDNRRKLEISSGSSRYESLKEEELNILAEFVEEIIEVLNLDGRFRGMEDGFARYILRPYGGLPKKDK